MPLLELKQISKAFPLRSAWPWGGKQVCQAVDRVSFSIEAGETFGLVGESGCGKSTAARIIMRLEEADSGKAFFDGRDLLAMQGKSLRDLRKEIQMVFQDPLSSLDPLHTILETVAEPLAFHGYSRKKERHNIAESLLAEVGLDKGLFLRYPRQLSGGQRQRVGIARALALNPRLLVADEVVSALDVSIQAQVLNLLLDLREKRHLTCLFISHNLHVIRYLCNNIGVMYLGKLMELAPKEDLFREPLHPYTQMLLAAIPLARGSKRKRGAIIKGEAGQKNLSKGCLFNNRCSEAAGRCFTENPPAIQFGARMVCCWLYANLSL
jgi:oligopeptide/dipeptide ABC transporter ATP-binding protein